MDRLLLIDSNALLHRAYHAYPKTLKTRKGELTNAVYGFTSALLSVLRDLSPKYVACAFDLPQPTFRHLQYKGYKAHRPKIDEELKVQIPRAKEIVRVLNIPLFEAEGYEADDIIGTLAKQAISLNSSFKKKDNMFLDLETVIVSGDKDALQLLGEKIKIFIPARGYQAAKIYNKDIFKKEYGFPPKNFVDYKSLVGDASDAIPGVKGIGPKTAKKLLLKFGSLKNIYKNLEKIETKVAKKLKKEKENAFLSYKLAKIILNAPVKLDLKKCLLIDYDKSKARSLFEELEFKSLLSRLPLSENEPENEFLETLEKKREKNERQLGLF